MMWQCSATLLYFGSVVGSCQKFANKRRQMKRRREFRIKGERPLIPSSIRVPHCPGPICSLFVPPEKRRGEKDERKERKTSFSCDRVSTNLTTLWSIIQKAAKSTRLPWILERRSEYERVDTIAIRNNKSVSYDSHRESNSRPTSSFLVNISDSMFVDSQF